MHPVASPLEEHWRVTQCSYLSQVLREFVTPQDTDFGKSLLQFADAAFLVPEAEDWLAFQVATTYGLDKATIKERLDWVKENLDLIERVTQILAHIMGIITEGIPILTPLEKWKQHTWVI